MTRWSNKQGVQAAARIFISNQKLIAEKLCCQWKHKLWGIISIKIVAARIKLTTYFTQNLIRLELKKNSKYKCLVFIPYLNNKLNLNLKCTRHIMKAFWGTKFLKFRKSRDLKPIKDVFKNRFFANWPQKSG